MTEFRLGTEDGSLGGGSWSGMDPQRGEVLEVYMPSTNLQDPGDFWAAFLVSDKRILSDGSILISVRCMGCEDVELFKTLQRQMGHLHLCLSSPCAISETTDDVVNAIHVTHLRRWEFVDIISADYISRSMRTQSRGWYNDIMARERGELANPPQPRRRKRAPKAAKPPKTTPGEKPKEKERQGPGLSDAAKDRLRQRLQQIRERAVGTGAHREPFVISDGEEMDEEYSTTKERSSSSAPDLGTLGEGAHPFPPVPPLALQVAKVKTEKDKDKKRKRRSPKRSPERRKASRRSSKDVEKVAATSGSTSKSWRRQLVDKAVLAADIRYKEKKKKRRKKDAKTKKVKDALALIFTGSSKKAKKKKSKKKRKITADGVIESYSGSSDESSSENSKSTSEETDLDTPMKKRSRDAPGSILAMLTNHVKEQLDQGATTELPDHGSALTSGIRVMTYFMLHLKPSFPNNMKELRELHHLAACIDVLRSGDIARTGDGLAARFISIHQALLDQNWGTAKHMELFPMEDATAATTSVVLATRKHTKMISKVQNQQAWNLWGNPYQRGRGKGKGDWWSGYDQKGDHKGEKGKGKKGKGKGKGKWPQSEHYDQDWKANKEKPDEKKA